MTNLILETHLKKLEGFGIFPKLVKDKDENYHVCFLQTGKTPKQSQCAFSLDWIKMHQEEVFKYLKDKALLETIGEA